MPGYQNGKEGTNVNKITNISAHVQSGLGKLQTSKKWFWPGAAVKRKLFRLILYIFDVIIMNFSNIYAEMNL